MSPLLMIFGTSLVLSFAAVIVVLPGEAAEKAARARLKLLVRPLSRDAGHDEVLTTQVRPRFSDRITEACRSYSFAGRVQKLIVHAGTNDTVGSVVLATVLGAVASAAVAKFAGLSLTLVMVAAAAGAGGKTFLLRWKLKRRLKKFDLALADAIELMARALRAGHSVGSAIEVVGEQSAEPVAGQFALCFQQQKFGLPLREALLGMCERVPSRDLHFLVTAMIVQKETGGDLTEIMDRTTRVIRERVRIEGEIKTYTAQGRLTGSILSALPVVMLGLINLITPGYSHILFTDPLGQKMLWAGVICIGIGTMVIRKIVDIKV